MSGFQREDAYFKTEAGARERAQGQLQRASTSRQIIRTITHEHSTISQTTSTANGSPAVKTFENRNPANTDEIVGMFAKGTAADMEAAAKPPLPRCPAGPSCPHPARGNILFKAADILEKKFDQLGAEMTREEGKTLPEAKGEVRRAINIFRYFAGEGSRMDGVMVPSERERVHVFALPQAHRRRRSGHAVEFPHRDSRVEDGAGADLRQHRHREAGLRFAAMRLAPGGSAA